MNLADQFEEAFADLLAEKPCCNEGLMHGNHYHCANCGGITGMMAHSGKLDDGSWGFICKENHELTVFDLEEKVRKLFYKALER